MVSGTLTPPVPLPVFGPLHDLGEAASPWRKVYAKGVDVADNRGLTIGGSNFADIAQSLRYTLPSNITVNELKATRITNETNFPPLIDT